MTTTTFYPEPNLASVAGNVTLRTGSPTSWAAARAIGSAGKEFNSPAIFIQSELVGDYNISRSIVTYDTSSIPDGDTINSAVLSLYATTGGSSPETVNPANLAVVGATPANTTSFDTGDFSQLGLTRYADTDVLVSAWNASTGYKNWTLNATGLAAITKTGVSIFGLRASNDFSDATAPSDRSLGFGFPAEESGTSTDPKLVVDHSSAATGNISASQTLQPVTQTSTATVRASAVASQTLAAITQTATARVRATATASQTLQPVTQVATSAVRDSAAANQTLQAVTQTATARARDTVSANQTLAVVTQTSTARARDTATASQTLQPVTQTASGDVDLRGTASQTLASVTQVTTVTVGDARNATATQTLQPISQTVTSTTPRNLSATQTLATITQTATGDVDVRASASQVLQSVTQVTSVTVGDSRNTTASQTLAAITQAATGDTDISAQATQTLQLVTQVTNGGVSFTLSANQQLDQVTQTASSVANVSILANQTLQPVTQNASDTVLRINADQTLQPITQVMIATTGLIRPNYVPSLEVDQVIDALRDFVLPFMQGGEVVRAQTNRVSMPLSPCAVLKEILQVNIHTPYTDYQPLNNTATVNGPQRIDVQIDFYGLKAGELCMSVKAAFGTPWASDQFPINIKPLYASDGMQSPLTTGEQQYESRWTLTASMQYNPIITVPQQFADVAQVIKTDPVDVFEVL